jgi:hypothetical protein
LVTSSGKQTLELNVPHGQFGDKLYILANETKQMLWLELSPNGHDLQTTDEAIEILNSKSPFVAVRNVIFIYFLNIF